MIKKAAFIGWHVWSSIEFDRVMRARRNRAVVRAQPDRRSMAVACAESLIKRFAAARRAA
jgi:hypothetical protein